MNKKLIGEGETFKWRAKSEKPVRKQKTSIKMDQRITRMAKAELMTRSGMIKGSLELPVSTVTGMCRRGYNFPKTNISTGLKRNGGTICGLMTVKLLFSVPWVADSW